MASHDRREFDKYLKFLTNKVTQVVIQSRQGRKIRTKSAPHGNEWFNVTIQDDKQVSSELKRSLEGRLPQQDCPVCIEILMETIEGESLVLEVWSVSMDYRKRDIGVSVTHLLYPRLSLMLKSLIALSRTTPAYRLAQQQEDNLKFNYRIYAKSPDLNQDFKTVQFAKTSCPYGTIALSMSYRQTIVFPDRLSGAGNQQEEPVIGLLEEDSNASESLSHKKMSFPFISTDPSSDLKLYQNSSSKTPQLFNAILPHPSSSPQLMSLSTTSRQDSGNSHQSDIGSYSREDSGLNSLSAPKESDGFIVVDFGEIKPTFVHNDSEEIANFLHPSRDAPDLDMFSDEHSTDINTALKIIGDKVEDLTN